MKKLLALVLALVMTLGLATVAANADFKDQSEVNLEQAVKVMSKVGVFKGNENGEFKPTANLDRASAAKLVAYLDLGEKAAEALPAVQVFNDVPASNWAAKYIAYCQNAGYIAGDGNGNFLPSTELSGYAFGKMVLCVLGYDPTIEGFVNNSNWTINIAKLLQSCGITDGVDTAASATLTREQAAQYCMNALKANMVEYDEKGTTISAGDITIQTGAKKAEKKLAPNKDAKWNEINADKDVNGVPYVQLGEKLYDGDLKLKDDTDAFGAPASTWKYKTDEIGTYFKAADATLKNKTTYGDIYAAIGKTAISNPLKPIKVFVDGVQIAGEDNSTPAKVIGVIKAQGTKLVKGDNDDFTVTTDATNFTAVNGYTAGTDYVPNGNGAITKVYIKEGTGTDAGKYDVTISVSNSFVAKVSSVNAATSSKDRSINLAKKDGAANTPEAYETEDFAKDDYVVYTAAYTSGNWKVQTIKKVTPTDVVDVSSKKSDGTQFVGSGTTYKFTKMNTSTVEVGDSYKLYLDDAGYVAYADLYNDATTYSNYLVIVADKYDTDALTGKKITANAITLDGVKLSGITLGKLNNNAGTNKKVDDIYNAADTALANGGTWAARRNTIYSFTKDSDGKYNLKTVAAPYTAVNKVTVATDAAQSGFKFHAGSTNVGGGMSANNNTKFVVVNTSDDNKVYTYDGVAKMANIKNADTVIASYLAKTGADTVAKVVFVNTDAKPANNAAQSKEIVYMLTGDYETSKSGDDNYATYSVIKDGVKTTVTMKKNETISGAGKGLWWIEEYDGNYVSIIHNTIPAAIPTPGAAPTNLPDDYSTDVVSNNVAANKQAAFADDVFTINGKSFLTDSKTAVYFIDKDENVSTSSVDALESTNTKYDYYVVMKTADKVTTAVAIYIQENK